MLIAVYWSVPSKQLDCIASHWAFIPSGWSFSLLVGPESREARLPRFFLVRNPKWSRPLLLQARVHQERKLRHGV